MFVHLNEQEQRTCSKLHDEQFVRTIEAVEESVARPRIQARCRAIHEELIAVVFHPDRIHSLIALYGQDVVEHL
jgi:hypothetical protein